MKDSSGKSAQIENGVPKQNEDAEGGVGGGEIEKMRTRTAQMALLLNQRPRAALATHQQQHVTGTDRAVPAAQLHPNSAFRPLMARGGPVPSSAGLHPHHAHHLFGHLPSADPGFGLKPPFCPSSSSSQPPFFVPAPSFPPPPLHHHPFLMTNPAALLTLLHQHHQQQQQSECCVVCGDRASGHHYGVSVECRDLSKKFEIDEFRCRAARVARSVSFCEFFSGPIELIN